MLQNCLQWLVINVIKYWTISNTSGEKIASASGDLKDIEDIKFEFSAAFELLQPGTYKLSGQKSKDNSASKMIYTFNIPHSFVGSVPGGNPDSQVLQLMRDNFEAQRLHQKEMNDLRIEMLSKQLIDAKKETKQDVSPITQIGQIVADFAKLSDVGKPANVISGGVVAGTKETTTTTTTEGKMSDEDANRIFTENLAVIGETLGGQGFFNVLKVFAAKAKENPEEFRNKIQTALQLL